MKWRYCVIPALLLCLACGRQERQQALGFYNVLLEKRATFGEATTMYKDLVLGVQGWCEGIIAGGAGSSADLDTNIKVARDLAASADAVSRRIGQVRQAVYDQSLDREFPLSVRNSLITELTRRQRGLQELRRYLEDAAAGFESLRQSRDYRGDAYPGAIDKLLMAVRGYKQPPDCVAEALKTLCGKYTFPPPAPGSI